MADDDGARLLAQIAKSIRKYVAIRAHEADAVALWDLAVHAFDAFDVFPRLAVTSVDPDSGKSTLLNHVARLVPRPDKRDEATAPSVYRSIDPAAPATLLLDEADNYLAKNNRLRLFLNSGHRRGGFITIVDQGAARRFPTWAPAMIAMIGKLPATLHSRSILIRIKRRRPDERIRLFNERDPAVTDPLERLHRQAARWAADHVEELRKAKPDMPAAFINRARDNWAPLCAVADVAGAEWPDRARNAAIEMEGQKQSATTYDELAVAIRTFLGTTRADAFSSDALVKFLVAMDGERWAEFDHGTPITKNKLSYMLREVDIHSQTIRFGGSTLRGYYRSDFSDFLARWGRNFATLKHAPRRGGK